MSRKTARGLLAGLCVVLLCALQSVAGTPTKSSSASTRDSKTSPPKARATHSAKKATSAKKRGRKRTSWHRRGQQQMQSERVREIQAALIREKYLAGEPTGLWDERSKQAMVRYQAENGWQTRTLPDSRALIKLGLGPNHAGLMNPERVPLPSGGSDEPNPGGRQASQP